MARLRIVLAPESMRGRVLMHSAATAVAAGAAFRMSAHTPASVAVWYVGSFVGFHVALLPFVAIWIAAVHRVERWVRGIVEEELIRFDLQTYQRQLLRVFPQHGERTHAPDEPADRHTP